MVDVMIRVRRSADDFLANLVQNIQAPEQEHRQRRPQRKVVAERNHASLVQREPAKRPQKEPATTRPAARKPPIKPPVSKAPGLGKPTRKPAQQPKKQPRQQKTGPAPIPQYLADNIEVIQSAAAQIEQVKQIQSAPNLPQNNAPYNQPQVESVGHPVNQGNNGLTNNFQQSQFQSQSCPIPPQAQSGNFYDKNRSNIFMQDPVSAQQNQAPAQQQVLNQALKIASQQPLPASPRTWQRERAGLDLITEASNSLYNLSQPAAQSMTNHHSTQQFSIAGNYTNTGLTQKEIERQKWIKDLEAQVAEKKRRLEAEKEKYADGSPAPAPVYQPNQQHPNPVLRSSFDHQPQYIPPPVETVNQPPQQQQYQHQQQYQQPQQQVHQPVQQFKQHPNPVLRSTIFGDLGDQQIAYSPPKTQYQPPPQIQQQQQVQSPLQFQQSPHAQPPLVQHPNPVLRSTIFSDGIPGGPPPQQYQPQAPPPKEMLYQQPGHQYQPPQPETNTPPPGGNLLGQHSMVDPLEMERRTNARMKAFEHQNSLREQVAEKERKKQEKKRLIEEEEAADRSRFEEDKRRMEEEKREDIARNIKLEQEKQQQVLEISRKMEESNKAAKLEKQRKRGQVVNEPVKQDSPNQQIQRQWAQAKVDRSPQGNVESSPQGKPGKMCHSPIPEQQHTPSPQQAEVQATPQHLVRPLTRYISEAGTQTVCEMSCQTSPEPLHNFHREVGSPGALQSESKLISISRENSHLMSDTAMLRLKTREMSTIQRAEIKHGEKKKTRIPERTKLPAKKGPSIPVRGKKEQQPKKPVEAKAAPKYDKHGHRIKYVEEEVMRPQRTQQPKTEPKLFTTRERSLVIEKYQDVSELFQPSNPSPPLPAQQTKPSVVEEVQDESKWWNNTPSELEVLPVASTTPAKSHATPHYTPAATPSGFSLNADQIQLKYSSPNNDNGYIPSAISSRQNDILGQLAQLRLGLQNRRRHMSNTAAAEMKV